MFNWHTKQGPQAAVVEDFHARYCSRCQCRHEDHLFLWGGLVWRIPFISKKARVNQSHVDKFLVRGGGNTVLAICLASGRSGDPRGREGYQHWWTDRRRGRIQPSRPRIFRGSSVSRNCTRGDRICPPPIWWHPAACWFPRNWAACWGREPIGLQWGFWGMGGCRAGWWDARLRPLLQSRTLHSFCGLGREALRSIPPYVW